MNILHTPILLILDEIDTDLHPFAEWTPEQQQAVEQEIVTLSNQQLLARRMNELAEASSW